MILQIWITKKIMKLDFQNVKRWNSQKNGRKMIHRKDPQKSSSRIINKNHS